MRQHGERVAGVERPTARRARRAGSGAPRRSSLPSATSSWTRNALCSSSMAAAAAARRRLAAERPHVARHSVGRYRLPARPGSSAGEPVQPRMGLAASVSRRQSLVDEPVVGRDRAGAPLRRRRSRRRRAPSSSKVSATSGHAIGDAPTVAEPLRWSGARRRGRRTRACRRRTARVGGGPVDVTASASSSEPSWRSQRPAPHLRARRRQLDHRRPHAIYDGDTDAGRRRVIGHAAEGELEQEALGGVGELVERALELGSERCAGRSDGRRRRRSSTTTGAPTPTRLPRTGAGGRPEVALRIE